MYKQIDFYATMQSMSHKIRKHLPNCDILGQLRDRPGVLLRVPVHMLDVNGVQHIEQALLRAGATGWHWELEQHSRTVKIRVYFERRWTVLAVLSIVVVLALVQYDIHKYLAKIVGRGVGTGG